MRDQFDSQGLRIETDDPSAAVVYSKGTHGINTDFPGSGTQALVLGNASVGAVRFLFSDPISKWTKGDPFYVVLTGGLFATLWNESGTEFSLYASFLDRQWRHRIGFDWEGQVIPGESDPELGDIRHEFLWTIPTNCCAEDWDAIYGMSLVVRGAEQVVMDDLIIEFVPEPSTGALMFTCLVAVSGGICLRRLANPLKHTRNFTTLALLAGLMIPLSHTCPANARTVTLDFESISSGTPVRDHFASQGLRIETDDQNAAVVYSKGTNGVPANFPGSGTQALALGDSSVGAIRFVFDDPVLVYKSLDPFVAHVGGLRATI